MTNRLKAIATNYNEILKQLGQEEANEYLKKFNFTQKSFEEELEKQSKPFLEKAVEYAGDLAQQTGEGLSFGLSKYVQAAADSLYNDIPYEQALARTRENDQDFHEKNPIAAGLAEGTGAMGSGAGLSKLAYKVLPGAINQAGQPVRNYLKDSVMNASLGAAEGSVNAVSDGGSAGKGALVGGGMGLLSVPVARALSGTGGLLADAFDKHGKRSKGRALDQLDESFINDGMSASERKAALKEFEDAGMGDDVTVGHIGKANVHQLGKHAINAPGEAKTKISESLMQDKKGNRANTQKFLQKGLKFKETGSQQYIKTLNENMKAKAAPYYEEAFKLPPINNPELDILLKVLNDTTKGDFYEGVLRIAKREIAMMPPDVRVNAKINIPEEMPYGNVPVKTVDFYKLAVDDLIGGAKGNDKRTLIQMRNKMLDIVDAETAMPSNKMLPHGEISQDLTSPYAKARKIWSSEKKNEEAYTKGRDAYQTTKSSDDVKFEMDALESEAERDMYRLGASTEAVTKMDNVIAPTKSHSKAMLSPSAQEKHKILFSNPNEADRFIKQMELLSKTHESANAMTPRSDTATNIMQWVKGVTSDMVTGGGSIGTKLTQRGLNAAADAAMSKRAGQTNQQLGNIYSARGANQVRGILNETEGMERQMQDKMIKRGLLTGAITSTGANVLTGQGLLE